ncbi:MAG: transporter, partial [Candidatus Krumholzibacteria bacterium]|nr:transporter [Candidatus Krumholzibacteria bacterium]
VTKRLDLSLAIPIVNVRMRADPVAYMNSFTFVTNDSANHFFDGTTVDPVLSTTPQPIDDDATGIGDIALQAKYNFLRGGRIELAALLGARLATGDEDNFLGAGDPSYRVALVASGTHEAGAPHLNLAYVFHQSELVRDQVDAFLAYDHKAGDRLTLAFEVLGRFEVGERIQGSDFPNSVTISRPVSEGTFTREVDLSNLPDFDNDHRISGGVGIKFAPRDFFVFIANVLVPLNDGGLRPDAIATLGFEFNF